MKYTYQDTDKCWRRLKYVLRIYQNERPFFHLYNDTKRFMEMELCPYEMYAMKGAPDLYRVMDEFEMALEFVHACPTDIKIMKELAKYSGRQQESWGRSVNV